MNPAKFYGKSTSKSYPEVLIKVLKNAEDSEDSLLSDSDSQSIVLAEDSDGFEDDYNTVIIDEIISETDLGENETAIVEIDEPSNNNVNLQEIENDSGNEIESQWDSEDNMPLSEIINQEAIMNNVQNKNQRNKNLKKKRKTQITWKSVKIRRIRSIQSWKGSSPSVPATPDTPLLYFRKLVDKDLLEHISEQSNLYASQCNVNKPLKLTIQELENFIGVSFIMSIYGLPHTRMFWKKETQVLKVVETMSRNRWEQIKSRLHFNDNKNLAYSTDKLYKIRPLIDSVVKKFNNIQMTEKVCVDEQIIPFKGRHQLKQYMRNKPKKWGYKAFVLCGSDGIVYNWELYSGTVAHDPTLPDVGVSGNVVMRLAKVVPRNQYYKIYYDNWFNSPNLQVELYKLGIHSLGTVRPDRLAGCNFCSDKKLLEKGRGAAEEQTALVDGVKLTAMKWYDNKAVHLLSSFVGVYPTDTVRRWDAKTKSRIDVPRPHAVRIYNKFMGGVDLLDSLIALYRTSIRSKKWYHKIYFHLMDLCVVNSWLLYKRDCNACQILPKDQLNLLEFKADLASTLCTIGAHTDSNKKGRPSSSTVEQQFDVKRKRGKTATLPTKDIRRDEMGHWPTFVEKRGRCKLPNCDGIPKIICTKCKVNLCMTPKSNCFLKFHTN